MNMVCFVLSIPFSLILLEIKGNLKIVLMAKQFSSFLYFSFFEFHIQNMSSLDDIKLLKIRLF